MDTDDEDGNDNTEPIGTRVFVVRNNPFRLRAAPAAANTDGVTLTIADAGIVAIVGCFLHIRR